MLASVVKIVLVYIAKRDAAVAPRGRSVVMRVFAASEGIV